MSVASHASGFKSNAFPPPLLPADHPSDGTMIALFGRGRHERAGFTLYGTAVAAARAPFHYAELGVRDTLDGRFDMVGLHVFLLIRRLTGLPKPGPAVAQAMFDAMFADMDVNLRELGVGDLSVGRKVKSMWEAFHGRSAAYQTALAEGPQALSAALARNVWRGAEPSAATDRLAHIVIAQDRHLAGLPADQLLAGRASFLSPEAL